MIFRVRNDCPQRKWERQRNDRDRIHAYIRVGGREESDRRDRSERRGGGSRSLFGGLARYFREWANAKRERERERKSIVQRGR